MPSLAFIIKSRIINSLLHQANRVGAGVKFLERRLNANDKTTKAKARRQQD